MIHRRKGRKLKRTASHRNALLANLSSALIRNKKIKTTLAKAKELRSYIEPLVTRSKNAYLKKDEIGVGVHERRIVYSILKDRSAVKTLFDDIGPKVSERNGGYTRVLKIGRRSGDGAEMAIVEFVDYNIAQTVSTDEKQSSKQDKKASETTEKSNSKKNRSKKKSVSAESKS